MSEDKRYFVFMEGEYIVGLGEAPAGPSTDEMLEDNSQLKAWELPQAVYDYMSSVMDRAVEAGELTVEEHMKVVPVDDWMDNLLTLEDRRHKEAERMAVEYIKNGEEVPDYLKDYLKQKPDAEPIKSALELKIESHINAKRAETEQQEKDRLSRLLRNHGPTSKRAKEEMEYVQRMDREESKKKSQEDEDRQAWLRLALDGDIRM